MINSTTQQAVPGNNSVKTNNSSNNNNNNPNAPPPQQENKKKKRKNKKKKSAKVLEENNSSDSDSDNEDLTFIAPQTVAINKPKVKSTIGAYHTNQLDDPVTVTIKQVIGKSNYSHERVASCVNRMWDTGLQYDSPEAVLAELQREDDKKVEEQDDYDEILDGKRRVGTNPPVPSLPPPVQIQTSQSSAKAKSGTNVEPTFTKPPALPSISFGRHTISPIPPQSQTAASTSKPDIPQQPPQQHLSLSARLEVIASHEDINQALIALISWCKITPQASLSFFQHDCYAIEIILQRFCTKPSIIHESNIRGELVSLLSYLLPPPSIKSGESSTPQSDHIHTLINSLTALLDQTARSTALKTATPLTSSNSIAATQISKLSPLALRLGQSLRKIHQNYEKTRATFNQSGSIFVIDEDINNMTESIKKLQSTIASFTVSSPTAGSGVGTGNGIKEKFELRELLSEVFQLQLKKLEAIQRQKAKSATSPSDIHLSSTISYTPQDNFALENAILLASGDSRRNIDALKLQASSSKSYYEKLFQDHESRLIPYQTDLHKLKGNLTELEAKKSKLLAEIQEIDEEMAHIATRSSTIQTFLAELQSQHEKQINHLNSSHGNVVEAIEKDNQINHLFTNLKNLESVMDEISTIGIESISSLSQTVQETLKTDILVDTFIEYSAVESKCIEFLTKRVVLMREKINYSQREVAEYKNLGMSNLAAEITLSIERMKENITEDMSALEALQTTVCDMLTSLHSSVRNHSVIRAMPSHSLQEIVQNLLAAGVTLRPELAPYNIPITPPGLPGPQTTSAPAPASVPAPAPAPASNVAHAQSTAKSSNSKPTTTAATAKANNSHSTSQPLKAVNDNAKHGEKERSKQVETKSNDRAEKKSTGEKKTNDKPREEKKNQTPVSQPPSQPQSQSQSRPQAAGVAAVAPAKDKKPSKESNENPKAAVNNKTSVNGSSKQIAATAPTAAPAPTLASASVVSTPPLAPGAEAPLPQRTNTRRKPNTPGTSEAAESKPAPVTPKKGPEQSTKSSNSIVTPPPGLAKSPDTKPGWSGWAPLPPNKKSGSLAQIQAEQASIKKAKEIVAQPVIVQPPAHEFPLINEAVPPPVKKTKVDLPTEQTINSTNEASKGNLPDNSKINEEEESNSDAKSDISIRGDTDDLDDDEDDEDDEQKEEKEDKVEEVVEEKQVKEVVEHESDEKHDDNPLESKEDRPIESSTTSSSSSVVIEQNPAVAVPVAVPTSSIGEVQHATSEILDSETRDSGANDDNDGNDVSPVVEEAHEPVINETITNDLNENKDDHETPPSDDSSSASNEHQETCVQDSGYSKEVEVEEKQEDEVLDKEALDY